MAAGPLAALGLKIADNLTYLALVFAGRVDAGGRR